MRLGGTCVSGGKSAVLRHADRPAYWDWAVACFRLATSDVRDVDAIAAMDADGISVETTRSRMELLDGFASGGAYPAEIGPGIWDIHSPRVSDAKEDGGASRVRPQPPGGLADLGQSGLRPEDTQVGRSASRAGELGRRCKDAARGVTSLKAPLSAHDGGQGRLVRRQARELAERDRLHGWANPVVSDLGG